MGMTGNGVVHLHSRRPGNHSKAIFLAKTLATGSPEVLSELQSRLWKDRPNERDGRFAVVGRTLLHLAGWSTCPVTVSTVNASMNLDVPEEANDTMQLRQWPYDVSNWPSVALSDAPGSWHMPRDQWEETHADP